MIFGLISIIIPTFQRVHILDRAYQSVKKQTFEGWELLIVDDGSTDGTENLVKKWQETDSRVHFYKRPKERAKGASTCRNIGIENAKGFLIAFLDSDDEWLERRLEKSVHFIREQKTAAIYSGAVVIGRMGKYLRPSRPLNPEESIFDFLLKNDSFIPTPSLILEASLAKKIKFNESLKNHEDYEFIINVGKLSTWTFFDNHDVIIHWEENQNNQVDYPSCLCFYEQYCHLSSDSEARLRYLSYMVENMVKKSPPYPYLDTYRSLFKKENFALGIRKKFLFAAPFLFHIILRIRKIFKSK